MTEQDLVDDAVLAFRVECTKRSFAAIGPAGHDPIVRAFWWTMRWQLDDREQRRLWAKNPDEAANRMYAYFRVKLVGR